MMHLRHCWILLIDKGCWFVHNSQQCQPFSMWLLTTILFALLSSSLGIKPGVFKACSDSAFCVRNRGVFDRKYTLSGDSLDVGATRVVGQLTNVDEAKTFTLEVLSVDGSVRLIVDESDAPRRRYRVEGVLEEDPPKVGPAWKATKTSKGLNLEGEGGASVYLQFSPFEMSLSLDKEVVMRVNGNNMFHVEHYRMKGEGDPEGWWEESFKQWTDSKPRGPQAVTFDLAFPGFNHLYGIPEHAMASALKPTIIKGEKEREPYRLYNLDVFEYEMDSTFGLYGAIPLMLAHKVGRTVGAFWLNAAEMLIDVWETEKGMETQWISESGLIDLFFFLGPGPGQVLQQYSSLTGFTALPQLFSLGYHQCRWNYRDEKDVESVDYHFDFHEMPYDVLWLDIEHTDGKRYMTWDKNHFPTPKEMQDAIASKGRKMVVIIDPHVKRDSQYTLHTEAQRLGYYVKTQDNKDYDGWCWPGSSSYLDVISPAVREWWAGFFQGDKYEGMTPILYVWNDMNEPSVFTGPEITMDKTNLHYQETEHRDIHNLYGYFYHMATAEGLRQRGVSVHGTNGDRPFVLSRAFFAGTQRIGPIWTGDNAANWDHLEISLPMITTLGLTGLPFVGADVGGFFGNPDTELLTRWYQFGIFYPFFRAHAHLETKRREPWLFGDEVTQRIKFALRTRYALLPYTYTRLREANLTGEPLARPLWYDFPEDSSTFAMDNQMMFGPAIMVVPVTKAGATSVQVHLPADAFWYDFWTGEVVKPGSSWVGGKASDVNVLVDLEKIPVFYKGGNIVAKRERPRRSSTAMVKDPFTLVVLLDSTESATGDLYIDDGHSFAFLNGDFVHRGFKFAGQKLESFEKVKGDSSGLFSDLFVEKIVILGLPGALDKYKAKIVGTNRPLDVSKGPIRLKAGLPQTALVVRQPKLPIHEDWTIQFFT